ncbi:MAG: peptidoglycan DD-metalloendopeptidase family protein [Bacteroidota bacterium]
MFRSSLKLVFPVVALLLCFSATAQNKKVLEKKRAELNKKIEQTNKLIQKTKNDQQITETQLVAITGQIQLREELIGTISSEIGNLNGTIAKQHKSVEQKRRELESLKAEYAKLIRYAQRNRGAYDRMMFIFSSTDFNQAYKRIRYLQQYTRFRREQAGLIEKTRVALSTQLRNLNDKKVEKSSLLTTKEREKQRLASDKEQEQKTLEQLKQEEKGLRAQLEKQEREKTRVNSELERLIAAELKKIKTANKGTFKLAPAAKDLSDNFEANRGSLPWPVEKGFISGRFGKQPHPIIKNITIDNHGIDITTDKEAAVRAIFRGTVSSILVIPGAGKVVVLDHGAYRSIYTQLKEVYVSKGQKINIKDKLGICLPGENDSRSEAHLEIVRISNSGVEKLNPALWISK